MESPAGAQTPTAMNHNSSAVLYHHAPPSPSSPSFRSKSNAAYPTTFVQADSSSFKHVVQMLTGSSDTGPSVRVPQSDTKETSCPKLYERRNGHKSFKISTPGPGSWVGSFRGEALSPSILDFPSLSLSPVTPLMRDPFNRPAGQLDLAAEEKAIREKGFYLHPSPVNTPRDSEPRLLPLFPVTSPKAL